MRLPALTIQKALLFHGFEVGPLDGEYGPKTQAAMLEWLEFVGKRLGAIINPMDCRSEWVGQVCRSVDVKPLEVAEQFIGDAELYDEAEGFDVEFGPAVVEEDLELPPMDIMLSPSPRQLPVWPWLVGGVVVGGALTALARKWWG